MLTVIFGDCENVIYNTSLYFKNTYEPDWLMEADTRQMILDIDKSTVISSGAIQSPVLGVIPPASLSGGVKTLILIDHVPDRVFNASNCGDNCASWLLRIASRKDVTVNLRHIMDFGDVEFSILIKNSGKTVHTMKELLFEAGDYV